MGITLQTGPFSGSGVMPGQAEYDAESNAVSFLLRTDGPAVRLDNGFGNGQPNAGTPCLPAAGLIRTVKAFKEKPELFGLDGKTIVGDGQNEFAVFLVQKQPDLCLCQSIPDGIVQQNRQEPL